MISETSPCRTGSSANCWLEAVGLNAQRRAVRLGGVGAAAVLVLGPAQPASARSRGIIVDTCNGCHGGAVATPPELSLSAEPATFAPGDSVQFTLTIAEPSIRVGGAFISAGGAGRFEALSGEGLTVVEQGMTHTAPKASADGNVRFRFSWRAPDEPGAVNFRIVALAGNGDNSVTGDSPGSGTFPFAYGCEGLPLYPDLDRDGFGSEHLGVILACVGGEVPAGFAAMLGDCDENNENVNPGATEVCNRKDDDCNGEIDENAPAVSMWPDGDGDGYYQSRTAEPVTGCGNLPGYAALGGDCDDADPAVNPEAVEICNGRDDDCDGEVDDRVRPRCGVGWCARYSTTCDPADCEPGPPAEETCNGFDDDCDGIDDNDACGAGMYCSLARECVAEETIDSVGDGVAPEPSSTPVEPEVVPVSPQPSVSPEGSPSPGDNIGAATDIESPATTDDYLGGSQPASNVDGDAPSITVDAAPSDDVRRADTSTQGACSLAGAGAADARQTHWSFLVTLALSLLVRRRDRRR